jgi:hypothetical protein
VSNETPVTGRCKNWHRNAAERETTIAEKLYSWLGWNREAMLQAEGAQWHVSNEVALV